jgi:monofunctional biosynthetic peptidoglycan transglycosylase
MLRLLLRALRVLLATCWWFLVVTVLWVLLLGAFDPPVTWIMVQQAREQGGIQREVVPLGQIARSLPLAVIASEDQRFMTHGGFAWEAIEKAREEHRKGKRLRGASTISQQTAKNVFLWPGRNMFRKGLEVWFTVLIEAFWTKERILEVYLNVAELGRGVFGAEAAAQHCFNIPAARLTRERSALIATTLPSPRRYDCRRPGPYLQGRQQWVLRQMRNIGDVLDPEVLKRRKEKLEREQQRKKDKAK